MDAVLKETLINVAEFYDQRKVGDVGRLGFRRSTDMLVLMACLDRLLNQGIIVPRKTVFFDLGCADARVNVFLSYLVKISVGVELDEWTLEEYKPLKKDLETELNEKGFAKPPENIFTFNGDSTDSAIHREIFDQTGLLLKDFDLFYTYLVMYEEFASLISKKARPGAIFMIYGLNRIMPRLEGLRLLRHISPLNEIIAVYQKA
jgi:hypothetical protein